MTTYTSDRQGHITANDSFQDRFLEKVYGCALGRFLIKPLIHPVFPKIGGKVLDFGLSACIIPAFVKKAGICMGDYEEKKYHSYNEFFTRKLAPGARKIDDVPEHFISPCDSRLSVYPVDDHCVLSIKHTKYTLGQLLKDRALAEAYKGGYVWVFRLCVDDYHRYIYVDGGKESKRRRIDGVLHTVNPVANDVYPIYKENSREYALLKSDHFGIVLMMEVGALLVGKIVNHPLKKRIERGQEKGYFAFGGSTIVLMTQKDQVVPDMDLIEASKKGIEMRVHLGEKIGCKK